MAWRVYAAAAIGSSHIEGGIPCQDAFAQRVDGERLLAVVCDGAGSQPRSDAGAQTISRRVVELLADEQLEPVAGNAQLELVIGETIAQARAELRTLATAEGVELSAYACTLVGVMANAQGGVFFHVGDGLGVAEADGTAVVSRPENGEYANETYFVSGAEWCEHLRFTYFSTTPRRIALMSDGAMPFAMAKGNSELFKPFMDPVESYLASVAEAEGSAALAGQLGDARTNGIPNDEQTLPIAT